MGTWGTGPFDSDSAEDFIDQLSSLDERGRTDVIGRVFNTVVNDPDTVMRMFVPEEVIAGAAIVSASLAGSETYVWIDEDRLCRAYLSRGNARMLADVALRALNIVVDDSRGWWSTSWVEQEDRMRAELQLQEIRSLLS